MINDQSLFLFNRIYKENTRDNSKKKLMLLPQFGTVELTANFYREPCFDLPFENELPKKNIKRVYRQVKLEVTTYQMCVLDMFNTNDTITFKVISSSLFFMYNFFKNYYYNLLIYRSYNVKLRFQHIV